MYTQSRKILKSLDHAVVDPTNKRLKSYCFTSLINIPKNLEMQD